MLRTCAAMLFAQTPGAVRARRRAGCWCAARPTCCRPWRTAARRAGHTRRPTAPPATRGTSATRPSAARAAAAATALSPWFAPAPLGHYPPHYHALTVRRASQVHVVWAAAMHLCHPWLLQPLLIVLLQGCCELTSSRAVAMHLFPFCMWMVQRLTP